MLFNKIFIRKAQFSSLNEYMEKKNLSRKELAEKLGITEQYLSFYFNGKRTFGAQTALRISRITGIPLENLIK